MPRRPAPAASRQRPAGKAPAGTRAGAGTATPTPRHGLARVLSKLGVCSRTEAARWVADGRVSVAGRVVRDPEFRCAPINTMALPSMASPWPDPPGCT